MPVFSVWADLLAMLQSHGEEKEAYMQKYKQAEKESNPELAAVYSGQGVGEMDQLEPAHDILTKINQEAIDILTNLPKQLLSD